jgi:hypothetical protein
MSRHGPLQDFCDMPSHRRSAMNLHSLLLNTKQNMALKSFESLGSQGGSLTNSRRES